MKHRRVLQILGTLLLLCLGGRAQQQSLTRFVDPFVGTGGHGHTFPGATLPFGMVQLSPDTRLTGWDGCSGYHYSDERIYGFSHTHLSGTGVSDYGDVLLMPTVGAIHLDAVGRARTGKAEQASGGERASGAQSEGSAQSAGGAEQKANEERTGGGYSSRFSHRRETASPGYYSVQLDDYQTLVELTTTARVGLHRYTFPRTEEANVILDLTHRDRVLDSGLRVVGRTRVEGFRRSEAWARDQIVYFVAEFSQPFESYGVAVDGQLRRGLDAAQGANVKSFFRFDARTGKPLLVKVAISAVSIEGARRNLAAELPGWDFARVRDDAEAVWNKELNRIQVEGGTRAQLTNFYTALYHTMLAPNLFMDTDGQFRGRDLKTHTARGFTNYTVFSLWDTFRAAHPLYNIIERGRTRDFVQTFLAQYEQGGRLPVWELAGNETDCMIGYHAVSVIADAVAKGIEGFDLERAFDAMKHSARLKHFGLGAYMERGYISAEDEPESVSKTLEYAYDDWCIAQVARRLGRADDYDYFSRRAQFYKNVFDPSTGFMRARRNGNWLTPFDPREVNNNFTEANAWQYSFFVPQDTDGLMSALGGSERFAGRLDELFTADSRTTGREQADITGLVGQYAHGNEPSHHVAYLYSFAGQPWKTQARVRQLLADFYAPRPDGLVGNEDCGQMSAWYVLSAAGFYPVTPGSNVYVVGSPIFREVRFRLDNGRSFVVRAPLTSARNRYIQSATLDGQPYRKAFFTHEEIMRGARLTFRMGAKPQTAWGTARGDAPATRIEQAAIVPVPVVEAPADTFREHLAVSLACAAPASSIYYTIDGSTPTRRSTLYTRPFNLERAATVRAVAFDERGAQSLAVSASFRRLMHDWRIRLLSKYSPQYAAGGDDALIDGRRGGANFRTGLWQGYQGQDFEAVLDLGELQDVSKIGAGFLQDVRSWIWMPTRVEFELSTDGVNYTKLPAVLNDVPERSEEVTVRDFTQTTPQRRARYIKIKASNYGTIPTWHAGAGGAAWIFIDEITVE